MAARITVTASGSNGLGAALTAAKGRARRIPATIANAVADPAAASVLDGARGARGSLSISGIRARLDVHEAVTGGDGHADLILSATPRRAWGLASGAKPHLERPRRRQALKLGPRQFAEAVHHPGTRHIPLWRISTARAATVIKAGADRAAAAANPFRGG